MGTLIRDLKIGLRMLTKDLGFTATAVLTLALGIGANSAIFSVVYRALLRPLPYYQPERIVTIGETRSQTPLLDSSFANTSYPDYIDWTQQAKSFAVLGGYSCVGGGELLSELMDTFSSGRHFSPVTRHCLREAVCRT